MTVLAQGWQMPQALSWMLMAFPIHWRQCWDSETTQGLSRKDPGLISDVCLSEGGREEFTEILHPWSSKSFPCFNTSFQALRTEAETKQGSTHLVKYYPDNVWSQEQLNKCYPFTSFYQKAEAQLRPKKGGQSLPGFSVLAIGQRNDQRIRDWSKMLTERRREKYNNKCKV